MKSKKCLECGNETRDEDGICVLSKKDITKMYKELMDLLINDDTWIIRGNKIKLKRSYKKALSTSRK